MKSTVSAKRKGDAVINIYQDNSAKQIVIERLNPAAERIIGYSSEELAGQKLARVLSPRVKDSVESYVEFDDVASDFANVARKIPNFQLLSKDGKEVPVSLKVFYLMSDDKTKLEYELLMHDITLIKRIKELKERLSSNKEEESVDPDTGFMSSGAIQDSLSVAYMFIEEAPIDVSFATVSIDNLGAYVEQYGEEIAFGMVKQLGHEVEKTCRDEDLVGHLGAGDIGLVLLDCSAKDANAVLNRINKKITSKPMILENGVEANVTLSVVYFQVDASKDLANHYNSALEQVGKIQESGGNTIAEV